MQHQDPIRHDGKIFSNVDYAGRRLENREFVGCTFDRCDFTKADLRGNDFIDCKFLQCNLTMVVLDGAGFRDAMFNGSKLLGVDFTRVNRLMYSFAFTDTILDYSTFYGTKLRKVIFKSCSLKETDFSEVDLSGATFENCDLFSTKFNNTILERTDFTTARNFSIDPDGNKMKHAKFSALNLAGLLSKYQIDIRYDAG